MGTSTPPSPNTPRELGITDPSWIKFKQSLGDCVQQNTLFESRIKYEKSLERIQGTLSLSRDSIKVPKYYMLTLPAKAKLKYYIVVHNASAVDDSRLAFILISALGVAPIVAYAIIEHIREDRNPQNTYDVFMSKDKAEVFEKLNNARLLSIGTTIKFCVQAKSKV